MKYAILIYSDETIWEKLSEAEQGEVVGRYMAISEDLEKRGQFILGEPLDATTTASTLRLRDGKALVTDGPFAETREQLGGFYVVDVPELPGCMAHGATRQAAIKNAEHAIKFWIKTAKEDGQKVPEPRGRLMFA